MLKKFFGKAGASAASQEMTIEDLIVLERYEEAIDRLELRAKDNPRDLHAHLRLAEVLAQVGKGARALDQYLYVADMYAEDGFYDKALALLTKIARLAPGDDSIRLKSAHIHRLKQLEHSRVMAIEGIFEAQKERDPLARTSPVEVENFWQALAATSIVQRFSSDNLRRLFSGAVLGAVESGVIIARAEARDEFVCVVVSGSVEARCEVRGGRAIQLRNFYAGDVFGERSLLEHLPWPASFVALERTRTIRIEREGLERAMQGNPDPRGLLDALRAQHNDRDVAQAAERVARAPQA